MKRLACSFNLKEKKCQFENENVLEFEKGHLRGSLCGSMLTENGINDWDAVWKAYAADPDMKTQKFGGLYLLMIYDEKTACLHLYQDFLTSPITAYYACAGDILYVDTSLKHLLARSGLRPQLNPQAARQFVKDGVMFGAETLLQGVFKLSSFHAFSVRDTPVQYPVKYDVPDLTQQQAKQAWENTLQGNILSLAKERKAVHMPISSGYDSNYILWTLNRSAGLPIHLYSIGAKQGVSELDVVKENIACYPDASLVVGCTSEDTLAHMDDIVWRLDGSVYEVGVFLQYELARLISVSGGDWAICGECADQVMNEDFRVGQAQVPDPAKGSVLRDPYAVGSGIVLKKSGIMLNSFSVEGCYPYIDLGFYGVCRALAPINKKTKLYHKQVCEKCLPKKILRRISKVGGSTSLHSLFRDQEEIKMFCQKVEATKVYALYMSAISEKRAAVQARQVSFIGKIRQFIHSEPDVRLLAAKVLAKLRVSSAANYTAAFRAEERKLNDYMKLHYLDTFERLYVRDFQPDRING